MALFDWKDSYRTNVGIIDSQHQKLVGLLNELHVAMQQGKGKEVLGATLAELVDYTAIHFKTEEMLFDQHNYPQTIAHKKEHLDLTNQAVKLLNDYKGGKVVITVDVLNFLRDWLKNHILLSDKAYAPFLKSKGVA